MGNPTDPGREVRLTAGDTTYTLYCGNRALRLIERETGAPFGDVGERIQRLDVGAITVAGWALLQRHHPDLTIDDTDDLIDAAGFVPAFEAINRAMERAFPDFATGGDAGKAPKANGATPGPGTKRSPAPSRPG